VQLPPVSLPRLHTLEIDEGPTIGIFQWISRCVMPSLRSAQIGLLWGEVSEDVVKFYRLFGSNLTTLRIDWSEQHFLAAVLDLCHSLRFLTLDYRGLDDRQARNLSLSSIERIGISIPHPLSAPDIYELDDAVEYLSLFMRILLQTPAPALTCVRFSGFDLHNFREPVWMDSHIDLWKKWIEWKGRGVRFEFSSGDLVEIPQDVRVVNREEEGLL
jgi:hypothetical protein